MWAWKAYTPLKAQPDELKFQLLDESERQTGSIAYASYRATKGELSSPWGQARIAYGKGLMSGPIVTLNDKQFISMGIHPLKKKIELTFADGRMIVFGLRKGSKNDIEFLDDKGFIGLYEEKGALPDGASSMPQLTKDEVEMLQKDQRPRSIETRKFTQVRLKTSGELPVSLEEIKIALMIVTSWVMLADEIPV